MDHLNIPTYSLRTPIKVANADGTPSASGLLRRYALIHFKIKNHEEQFHFYVSQLGTNDIFIGHDWLIRHNPTIDWTNKSLSFNQCFQECFQDIVSKEEKTYALLIEHLRSRQNHPTWDIPKTSKKQAHWKSLIPHQYHDFESTFTKATFDKLPQHTQWDHKIDLIPEATEYFVRLGDFTTLMTYFDIS